MGPVPGFGARYPSSDPGSIDYLPRLPRDEKPCGGCGCNYTHHIGDCIRNLHARIQSLEAAACASTASPKPTETNHPGGQDQ